MDGDARGMRWRIGSMKKREKQMFLSPYPSHSLSNHNQPTLSRLPMATALYFRRPAEETRGQFHTVARGRFATFTNLYHDRGLVKVILRISDR